MDNYRLFMVPGMNHCGGGPGTTTFDMLAALEQWVEKKQAPDSIPASHVTDGKRRSHAPAVPVSAGRDLQGIRKHGRSRELRL